MNRKLLKSLREEFIKLYGEGYTLTKIAEKYKCSVSAVSTQIKGTRLPNKIFPHRRKTLDDFYANRKKNEETGCIEWTGKLAPNGYGYYQYNRRNWYVHRLEYVLKNGPLKSNIYVCHKCDNPKCLNLDHLFEGTPLDNMIDRTNKCRVGNSNLKKEDILNIRASHKNGESVTAISKKYGLSYQSIASIVKRISYKYI